MPNHFSKARDYSVFVSEADALTVVLALKAEQVRREKLAIKDSIEYTESMSYLIGAFDIIAFGRACEVCGDRTVSWFDVPVEGDGESGPYTVKAACCTECKSVYADRLSFKGESDKTFEAWMVKVDSIMEDGWGVCSEDIPDWGYMTHFLDGMNPTQAAFTAIKEASTF